MLVLVNKSLFNIDNHNHQMLNVERRTFPYHNHRWLDGSGLVAMARRAALDSG